jgi:hypothetical protein
MPRLYRSLYVSQPDGPVDQISAGRCQWRICALWVSLIISSRETTQISEAYQASVGIDGVGGRNHGVDIRSSLHFTLYIVFRGI